MCDKRAANNGIEAEKVVRMSKRSQTGPKIHYICQTYSEKTVARGKGKILQIQNQYPYKSAEQAEDRARRAVDAGTCVGADAFMITEDRDTGDVSEPTFLLRLGNVPELEY
jgi:hypothetical protein